VYKGGKLWAARAIVYSDAMSTCRRQHSNNNKPPMKQSSHLAVIAGSNNELI